MTTPSRKDRSRAAILDAADSAFRTAGLAATTVEDIALRAGLTRKTVYNLFASKEDIALALIARVEAGDAAYRARLVAAEDACALLEAVLLDSAGWCMAHPDLARLALSPRQRPGTHPPAGRPSFHALVRDIVALGQVQGRVRPDEDAGLLALMVLALFGQSMLSALAVGHCDPSGVRQVLRLCFQGIGPQGRAADGG